VTRSALPKLRAYAAFAAVALAAAVAFGRPELVSLAAPFAVFLAVGLARVGAPAVALEPSLERDRVIEGDELELTVRCSSATGVDRLELRPIVPPGLERAGPPPRTLALRRGQERTLAIPLRARRWGAYRVGGVEVRAFDRFGLVVDEGRVEPEPRLRVYPDEERLQQLLRPLQTQPTAGNQVARTKGDGIEFADIRPFAPGDLVRRVNWRASARRGELQVNESHPERNADVVLFLDSFAEARRADEGTLDRAVRAAASLASAYLGQRDRVGFVAFGGTVRWLTPATAQRQLVRIVDALLETEIALSYTWKKIDVLPARTLPPQSLVLALTPLLDERALDALVDLRARGFDLAIVDLSPMTFVGPARDARHELALRLWRLWRTALRDRYERHGVPVVEWREDLPLAAALEEVRSFRRSARRSHA
jgi:uncharacterized protein (DUF58 family)